MSCLKRRDEKAESLRLDRMETFEVLGRQAARWARDNRVSLARADPAMPAALFNRVADNWRPLMAIADAVGGKWPERVRRVAEAAAAQDKDESARTMLLADLRESGSIEQDSDVVILLHREDVYERESPRAGEADLHVAKHRNGPTTTVTVAFQGHYSRFVDMAPG